MCNVDASELFKACAIFCNDSGVFCVYRLPSEVDMSYLRPHGAGFLYSLVAVWLTGAACPIATAAEVTISPGSDQPAEQGLSEAELAAVGKALAWIGVDQKMPCYAGHFSNLYES